MHEENEPLPTINGDEQAPSGARGFKQEELVSCPTCLRANPPTRTSCLYCGVALPFAAMSSIQIKPTMRPLETWEQGYNVIFMPNEQACSNTSLNQISDLVRLDLDDVRELVLSGSALPLARCLVRDEALVVETRLNELGFSIEIVADRDLDDYPPVRVRTMDLTDDSIVLFPMSRADAQSIPWREISLIVVGRRVIRRLEVAERAGKGSGKEVVDSREMSTDTGRLDLYSKTTERPWHIAADNFDFSFLHELKTLIAAKNFQSLAGMLRLRAESAGYDESYMRVRRLLGLVWPIEERTESLGLRKPRMGRINTEMVTTSDNEKQFARYSRLLQVLNIRRTELKA